jgi:TetR/AcrR family transcriptional regulator, cholesterol catabolism regulator
MARPESIRSRSPAREGVRRPQLAAARSRRAPTPQVSTRQLRAAKPNAAKGSPAAQDTGGARGERPALRDDSPRGRILRAAAHLFHTRGYAQTTVRDLARSVGILSGSIFHHFDSKEAILEAVLREVSARGTERMRSAAGALGPPLDRVRALLRCELDSIHGETSEAMTLLASEWRSLGPDAQTRVLRVRDEYEAVWLTSLAAARRELVAVDPFILRRLIQGMTAGSATWYRRAGPVTLDELTEKIMSLIARQSPARLSSDKLAVGRKPTRAVGRKDTRKVGRKATRTVGRKDTRAVERKATRTVGREGEHVMDRRAPVKDRGGEYAVAHEGERIMDRKQEKTR